ncbi:MAG: hypothetical protein DRJ03_01185 [Chloroflexi bacterium]|nr:MAG: hypothetical protein DRJ03_01185 [Chloroflexota bacterium]
MRKTKLHEIDYKTAKLKPKPIKGELGYLPAGRWLPVSAAAKYAGCTPQTVRLLYFTGRIKGLLYGKGPLLVDVQFLPGFLKRSRIKEI